MAQILLQGPNGQKVYSDPSSADHAAYLAGGFKPVDQTPAPAQTQAQAPAPTQNQAPAPVASTNPVSAPKSDPNPPGPINQSLTAPGGGYVGNADVHAQALAMSQQAGQQAGYTQTTTLADKSPNGSTTTFHYSPPTSIQGLGTVVQQAAQNLPTQTATPATPAQVRIMDAKTASQNYDDVTQKLENGVVNLYGTPIPKATLISPTGQQVIVRTDNKTGTSIPTAQEYFAKGYVLMTTPGVYKDPTTGQTNTFGTVQLPGGTTKPQTASQAQSAANISSANAVSSNGAIPFRAGLSQSQQQSIQTLVQNKPTSEWTATDKANWSYATNNAPLPNNQTNVASGGITQPTQGTQGTNGAATGATGTSGASGSTSNTSGLPDFPTLTPPDPNATLSDRIKQFTAIQNQIVGTAVPTADELSAQSDLNALLALQQNLNVSKDMGLSEIAKQPIAMPFVQGQQSAVERDAAIKQGALSAQMTPIEQKIAMLQAQRKAASDVASSELNFLSNIYNEVDKFNPPNMTLNPGQQFIQRNASGGYSAAASGGAPILQPSEVASLSQQLRQNDITAGNGDQSINDPTYYQRMATSQLQGIQGSIYGVTNNQTGGIGNGAVGSAGANTNQNGVPNYLTQPTGVGNMGSGQGGMRTDRSNNPTAMTTDVAAQAGLKLGQDYTVGSPFTSGGKTYYTANLVGDPIAKTIQAIDKSGFFTSGGQPRWSYLNSPQLQQQWPSMTPQQKAQVIYQMYQREGNQGALNPYFQKYGVGVNSSQPMNGSQASSLSTSQLPALLANNIRQTSGGASYISTKNMSDAQKPIAVADAAKANLPVLDETEEARLQTIDSARNSLDMVDSVLKSTTAQFNGPLGSALHYVASGIGNVFGVNVQDRQTLQSLHDTVLSVAAAISGSGKGSLKSAIPILNANIPTAQDSYDVATQKLTVLKNQLDNIEQIMLQGKGAIGGTSSPVSTGGTSTQTQAYLKSIGL